MIYKVLTLNEWQSAKESGTIVTEIDQNDGFVHLSTSSQLSATLSKSQYLETCSINNSP